MDEIRTQRLLLRRFLSNELESQDLQWFHEVWSNEAATQWSARGPCTSERESQAWMAGILPSSDPSTPKIAYAVLCPAQEEEQGSWDMAGIITLLPIKSPMPVADKEGKGKDTQALVVLELGYIFLPWSWGHGYATESLQELLRLMLADAVLLERNARGVDVRVNVHLINSKSLRVVEKLGFDEVGRFEVDDHRFPGGFETTTVVQHRRVLL